MGRMVERIAQALCEAQDCDWDRLNDGARHIWRCDARLMLQAMREPTEAMEQMAIHAGGNPGLTWKAMIDAALVEGINT